MYIYINMCIQNFLHICLHLHIVYLCDPVWMKVLAPHVGFDVSWGQLSHHRRKWQRFHEGCQTVAGGTRGSLTLQDPQDAKDSVILSMFESRSTGLAKRLLAFQQHIAVEVCDSLAAGIPCASTTLVISLSVEFSGYRAFRIFWISELLTGIVFREYLEASSLNCLEMAPPRFTMAHHNTEPNPMNSWRSHWDGLGSASVKSYG